MITVPKDIWLRVAQYLPDNNLKQLLALNSVFFELAMNARYQDVLFCNLGSEKRMRRYARLKDPFVAKRVRNVHVWLSLNDRFLREWRANHLPEKKAPEARTAQKRSWKQIMSTYVRGNKSPFDGAPDTTLPPLLNSPCGPDDDIIVAHHCPYREVLLSVTETVAGFRNVVRYTIGPWDTGFDDYVLSFFAAAWSAFGSGVQVLSLDGAIDFSRIPPPLFPLPALRELHLSFPDLQDQDLDSLVPFINEFGRCIRCLHISSMGLSDLSSLLGAIGYLPHLERFRVNVPFSEAISTTPGLTHLLRSHASTLRHINLRLDSAREEGEGNLGRWMEANVSDDATLLANLTTLQLCVSQLANFATLGRFVRRSADTLTSLAITHRFCSYLEVDAIASTFSHRPRDHGLISLSLYVDFFGPRILDLLAGLLPDLQELTLNAFNWGAQNCEWEEKLDIFEEELRRYSYQDWKLTDIGVWLRLGYEEMVMQKMDYDNMLLIAESIPSIRKFWGESI